MSATVFATCDYRRFHPSMGIPVRTSHGRPKWPLPYPLVHAIREVTPHPGMLSLDYDTFRRRYRHQLHRATIHRVLAAAQRIRDAEHAGPDVLVLLCFENLADHDTWCHRSLLGEWLRQQTGDEVAEYGDLLVAQPVRPAQTALFTA